jgi:hypothetical protein
MNIEIGLVENEVFAHELTSFTAKAFFRYSFYRIITLLFLDQSDSLVISKGK